MKSLAKPLPGKAAKDIFRECVNDYSKKDMRTKLLKFLDGVERCSEDYNINIPHDIENFVHPHLSEEETTALQNVYNNKFAKEGYVGKKYYNAIMAQAGGICPICGTGYPANLDHYLPKSIYSLLVVTPLNLVPSCRDCNFGKGSYLATQSIDLPLHPYFDNIRYKWLEAHIDFVNDGSFSIIYYNGLDESVDYIMKHRLDIHIKVHDLQKTFASRALTEIDSIKYRYKKMLLSASFKEFENDLKDVCESAEIDDLNSWKSALYRALLRQIEDYRNWLDHLKLGI